MLHSQKALNSYYSNITVFQNSIVACTVGVRFLKQIHK